MRKLKLNHISLEVTSICNLRCKYCYNTWKAPGVEDFKAFNSYKQARKTLKRLFKIADINNVTFTGGEPFLAERFSELVLYTRLKRKNVTIISNGNAAKEGDYQQMLDFQVGLFELPIHSAKPEIHDYLTEIPGSWQKSVNSIKFLKSKNAELVVVIVITKANYKDIDKTLEFINDLGIQRIMLNRFNIGGQGIIEKDKIHISKAALNEAFRKASTTGKKLNLRLTSNVCTPLCVVDPRDFPNIRFSTCSPDVKRRPLTIDIWGDLRFCNHSPTVLGNIFHDNLEQMLSSEKALLWSKTVPEFCSSCDLYSNCMAGCRAASEQLNQSLNSPDPIVLEL